MSFALMQICVVAFSQSDNRRLVRKGNLFYLDSMFVEAETSYRDAIKKNGSDHVAHFNLGNALLRERNPKDAATEYEEVVKRTKNPLDLAKAYHNMGIIFHSQKQYKEAILCYENALRNNSHDDESRYNLALCKHLLKNQDNQQRQDNQEQNREEKKDDKQQEKPQQNDESEKKQKQPSQNQMSEENAERLLDVAKQEEQRTQEKLRKGQRYATPRRLDKNW